MLAEPRNKQKWSADPRNTHWATDKTKFGYKLMSQMGWSEGKGLGANESGTVTHVKVTKKNNSLGVGAKVSNEDNWLAHQDDFNSLLDSLNKNKGTDNAASRDSAPKSLEATVRNSKKKIFYSKLVKSKDLSRASKQDLDSIFGNRSKSAPTTPCNGSKEASEDESDDSTLSCPVVPDAATTGFLTTTSQFSMAEYFAQKMAARSTSGSAPTSPSHDCVDIDIDRSDVVPSASDVVVKRKKSKKRKRSDNDKEIEVNSQKQCKTKDEDNCDVDKEDKLDEDGIDTNNSQTSKKLKRKKSKKHRKERS